MCKEVREAAVRDFRKDMTEQTANINWGRKKVMRIVKLNEQTKDGLIRNLLKRSPDSYGEYEETVNGIIKEIREKGDKALFGYTQKFDRCEITAETVRVTKEEIKEAYELADPELVAGFEKNPPQN